MDKLTRFGVAVPVSLLEEFDRFMAKKGLSNRSEAIRQLIRENISKEVWTEGTGTAYGTVTIMYDHHARDAAGALTSLQHDYGDSIVCTTHVHVDHHRCLECIVLKGDVDRIRRFVDELSSIRGVQSIDPSISAVL